MWRRNQCGCIGAESLTLGRKRMRQRTQKHNRSIQMMMWCVCAVITTFTALGMYIFRKSERIVAEVGKHPGGSLAPAVPRVRSNNEPECQVVPVVVQGCIIVAASRKILATVLIRFDPFDPFDSGIPTRECQTVGIHRFFVPPFTTFYC